MLLTLKASSTNRNNSEFLRCSIVDSNVSVDSSRDRTKLISSLNRIGNNINQIAHVLNSSNMKNILNDVDYDNLLNELVIIESHLSRLS